MAWNLVVYTTFNSCLTLVLSLNSNLTTQQWPAPTISSHLSRSLAGTSDRWHKLHPAQPVSLKDKAGSRSLWFLTAE